MCVCVCGCVCDASLERIIAFAHIHYHSTALFAPQQCLAFISLPTSFSSLSARH